MKLANYFGLDFHHILVAMDGNYQSISGLDSAISRQILQLPITKSAGLPNYRLFNRCLKETKPDLLVTYNFGAFEWLFSAIGTGVPHLHVEDGFNSDEIQRRFVRRNWMRKIGFWLSNSNLITISHRLDTIASQEWAIKKERRIYIANGVDLNHFKPKKISIEPPPELTIITAARLSAEKRIDRLIHAFSDLLKKSVGGPVLKLKIAGDGPTKEDLVRLVSQLQLTQSVEFLGFVVDPSNLYSEADIFALSSDTEQMPVSVLEAMASALPIASTDVGDVKKMVAQGNSDLIQGNDTHSLTTQLENLCRDPAMRAGLGYQNRQHCASKFGFDQMASEWRLLFDGENQKR